ncbi:MAG TPA: DUF3237 domain-containing protein [Nevskiaceae bacterium]|nr:DUF3237 domain-containing protein [Nevskiaceae bacterium]
MSKIPAALELLFHYAATLHPPEVIGPVPGGTRINFHISGGTVDGPRVRGKLRPVGADHFLLQTNGVGLIDVYAVIETEDGALIDLRYTGVADLGEGAHEAFLEGRMPPRFPLRTAVRARSAHPAYEWLNRLQCFTAGQADVAALTATYDVYTLR